MTKPRSEATDAAKAEIIRALYDAADRVFAEQGESGLPISKSSTAYKEFQKVLAKTRQLEDEVFPRTVERVVMKLVEQINIAKGFNDPNIVEDD